MPTLDQVQDTIKELLGFTYTGADASGPGGPGAGGLERFLPAAHPIFQNFVVSNVRVEPVRDEARFTVEVPDPDDLLEAKPLSPAIAWGSWKFDVTFMPRPYPMISDLIMGWKTDDWYDDTGALKAIQYVEEWKRFCVFQTAPREEYARAKLGDAMRFVTGSGAKPGGPDVFSGNPYPAIVNVLLPDDVLTVSWYNVPSRFVESVNSNLRKHRNRVNQKTWMGYDPGTVLYRSFKETRYASPFPKLDPNWGGAGVFATQRLTNLDLEFWVTRRTSPDLPATNPATENLNFVKAGWNLFPWFKDRNFYYAVSANADPMKCYPMFRSVNFGLIFRDPDAP